jgi:hypothetical protein
MAAMSIFPICIMASNALAKDGGIKPRSFFDITVVPLVDRVVRGMCCGGFQVIFPK